MSFNIFMKIRQKNKKVEQKARAPFRKSYMKPKSAPNAKKRWKKY